MLYQTDTVSLRVFINNERSLPVVSMFQELALYFKNNVKPETLNTTQSKFSKLEMRNFLCCHLYQLLKSTKTAVAVLPVSLANSHDSL